MKNVYYEVSLFSSCSPDSSKNRRLCKSYLQILRSRRVYQRLCVFRKMKFLDRGLAPEREVVAAPSREDRFRSLESDGERKGKARERGRAKERALTLGKTLRVLFLVFFFFLFSSLAEVTGQVGRFPFPLYIYNCFEYPERTR